MSNLAYFENIIKEKRKNTEFRDFVKEIASWFPFSFYRRKDNQISKFPIDSRFLNVIPSKEFAQIRDSLTKFGINYSGKLFNDFGNLIKNVPIEGMKQFEGSINTEFADIALGKNIYLTCVGLFSENVAYSFNIKSNCNNIFNSVMVWENSQNIYFGTMIINSFNIFYSKVIFNSNNIWYSTNLNGCSECILCKNLDNKSYCILDKQYSKEEYFLKKKEILNNKFHDYFFKKSLGFLNSEELKKYTNFKVENLENGFMNYNVKNARNIVFVGGGDITENTYDVVSGGMEETKDFYGVMGGGLNTSNVYCSVEIAINCFSIYYSYLLENCSFCLGCIGLKNKSFCILNKQYTKEEWYKKAEEIFSQMEKDGSLGEFFPGSLNPFYFNDTMAYLIDDSFTKEEVEKEGYMWREDEIKVDIPEGAEVVYTNSLAQTPPAHSSLPPQARGIKGEFLSDYQGFEENGNWQINPEIMKKVIKDSSGNVYKIVPMEYDFLMKHGLPLPEIHWLDRIKMGFRF